MAWKLLILMKKLKERACIHPDWLIRGQNLKNVRSKSATKLNQVLDNGILKNMLVKPGFSGVEVYKPQHK